MSNIPYTTQNGRILTENGLPFAPRWFCDGRTAIQVDNEGISDINYFGANTEGYIAFHNRFWGQLQFYSIDADGRRFIRPGKCEILPFGFTSDSTKCLYGVRIANEVIYITITPKAQMKLAVEFPQDYLFYPDGLHGDLRYGSGSSREWSDVVFADNRLSMSYWTGEKKTNVALTSNSAITYIKSSHNGRYKLNFNDLRPGEECVIALSLSNGEPCGWNNYKADLAAQYARYDAVAAKAPVLRSAHPLLNQFFELAPMYHESLKTLDCPGGLRAQSTHYWVWGWDSLTSNNCSFYWGDEAGMCRMLDFMQTYSDGKGIATAFNYDLSDPSSGTAADQGMFITVMDMCRLAGCDVSPYYDFACKLLDTTLSNEIGTTGFCKGRSLYPDFGMLIGEDGNDISAFNNTVSYCAARSMEKIAASMNDAATEEKARSFCERMEANFDRIMYNEKMGFISASVDATTYEQRNVASNNAVKWENNYCDNLVHHMGEKCLDFYEKNLVCIPGIRPHPEWSDSYDADANQLHSWWPVMSEFYTRLINRYDRPDLVAQYVGWVEYWTGMLMCPEGVDCYRNEEPPVDRWSAMSGIWHGYSMRGFYNSLVHCYIGVDFDEKGMNFYPYSGEEVSIEKLHFGARSFDVTMQGSGRGIGSVVLNGENLGSVTTIPYSMLGEHNTVVVTRT